MHKRFGRRAGAARRRPRGRRRRGGRAARPERLRQDHAPAHRSPGSSRPTPARSRSPAGVVAGDGVDVPPERRRVGMVFQDWALFPHLDVGRQRGLRPARRASARPTRVERALELVGLGGMAAVTVDAVGRPAAARGPGPRHRARAVGAPARRALLQPRHRAAGAGAHRAPRACSSSWASRRCSSRTTRRRPSSSATRWP